MFKAAGAIFHHGLYRTENANHFGLRKKMLTRDLSLPLALQEISDSLAECKMAHFNCPDSTVRLSARAGRKLTAQAKGKK
jgi:hypothetical protein